MNKKAIRNLKYILFIVLLLVPFCVMAETYFMDDDSPGLLMMYGMELFVTIHMSVFFLMPLSAIINKGKKWEIFGYLTILRIIILVIGNSTIGFLMTIIDFLMVFIGTFIIIPITYGIKQSIYKGKLGYHEYVELDEATLETFGYKDGNLLKNKLFDVFSQFLEAISNEDRNGLRELCQSNLYETNISSLDLYRDNNQHNYVTGIESVKNKLIDLKQKGNMLEATLIQHVKYYDYTEDATNDVVDGDKKRKQEFLYKLVFIKKDKLNDDSGKNCPNCGAPLGANDICSYCNTETIERKDWVLAEKEIIRKY